MVREEADRRGINHTRESLQEIGNELRQAQGPGVLGIRVRETIEREEGDFSWGSVVEKTYYALGKEAEPKGIKRVGEFLSKFKK